MRNGPNSKHKLKSKNHDKKTSTLRFGSASNKHPFFLKRQHLGRLIQFF